MVPKAIAPEKKTNEIDSFQVIQSNNSTKLEQSHKETLIFQLE